jgi:hypothetical protein
MEKDGDRQKKMEGHCSTGQSSHWAVVPVEEEETRFQIQNTQSDVWSWEDM